MVWEIQKNRRKNQIDMFRNWKNILWMDLLLYVNEMKPNDNLILMILSWLYQNISIWFGSHLIYV